MKIQFLPTPKRQANFLQPFFYSISKKIIDCMIKCRPRRIFKNLNRFHYLQKRLKIDKTSCPSPRINILKILYSKIDSSDYQGKHGVKPL